MRVSPRHPRGPADWSRNNRKTRAVFVLSCQIALPLDVKGAPRLLACHARFLSEAARRAQLSTVGVLAAPVSIRPFHVSRSRLRRTRSPMGIQSCFAVPSPNGCLPQGGLSRCRNSPTDLIISQNAPAEAQERVRSTITRSVRRASGSVEKLSGYTRSSCGNCSDLNAVAEFSKLSN